uniref:POX domain-containing protein n=1 Tax=Nelumbo nucifera TaxID=4432 RepID=A0A822ZBI2_NELNU|nr:TPA_asm: hypothetical protein HUJ06_015132 [Nelumbo nucifera]
MVSQDSSTDPTSSVLHQFIISDTLSSRTHFEDNDFATYQSDGRNGNLFPQSLGLLPSIHFSRSIEKFQAPVISEDSETCSRRHLMIAKETDPQSQRLSLSLGSHFPPHVLVPSRPLNSDLRGGSSYLVAEEESRDDYPFIGNTYTTSSTLQNQGCSTSYEIESFATMVGNSRYLKPAQSLLEEVVSVGGKAIGFSSEKSLRRLAHNSRRGPLGVVSPELQAGFCSNGFSSDLQTKIAKLNALLDEVDSRYEQYYHQMEEVVSSFEVIAGVGAAKSYTALALQAMYRHFRSLRDAIVAQINVAKTQASQDIPRIHSGLSQLSLFDQEGRHNRGSLQHLGMIQSQRQAWRPIRGLPENSVAILRSWLFEHFLHPINKKPSFKLVHKCPSSVVEAYD